MNPVRVNNVVYRSVAEACRRLGTTYKTVEWHLNHGTPDLIGKGKAMYPPRPYEEDGVTYPSLGAAAKALGISRQAVHQRANRVKRRKAMRDE